MKQEFINYLNALMKAAPDVEMTDGAKTYIDSLLNHSTADKPEVTDNGKVILKYLQSVPAPYKSKDIRGALCVFSYGIWFY